MATLVWNSFFPWPVKNFGTHHKAPSYRVITHWLLNCLASLHLSVYSFVGVCICQDHLVQRDKQSFYSVHKPNKAILTLHLVEVCWYFKISSECGMRKNYPYFSFYSSKPIEESKCLFQRNFPHIYVYLFNLLIQKGPFKPCSSGIAIRSMKNKVRTMINFSTSAELDREFEIKNTFSLSTLGHNFLLKGFCKCDWDMSLRFLSQLKDPQR